MKKLLLVCLVLSCLLMGSAFAADYYVAKQGNDNNDGLTDSTAWQTIDKVNNSSFQPGDTIHFRCGDEWRDQLNAPRSNITITSYPENCPSKPVINSALEVTDWHLCTNVENDTDYCPGLSSYGNIYYADVEILDNYIDNGTFGDDVAGWNVSDGVSISRESGANCVIEGDGCLRFKTGLSSGNITSNVFKLQKSSFHRNFMVNFRASANSAVDNVQIILKNSTDTALDKTITMAPGWTAFTFHFQIGDYKYLENATMEIHLPAGSDILLDDISVKPVVSQLFANGNYIRSAHHPNESYLDIDYANDPATDKSYLTDDDLAGSLPLLCDPVDAEIHIRTVPWTIEDKIVSTFDGASRLSWYGSTSYSIQKDYGYYLDNKLCMLDQPGEWYYDEINKKLYIQMPDAMATDPNLADVEVSINDYGIYVRSRDYITIKDLQVRNAAIDGIAFNYSRNFVLDNVDVLDSGHDGIYINDSNVFVNGTIDNCLISKSVNEGITVLKSHGMTITNNTIEYSGKVGSPKDSRAAINMNSSNYAAISNNVILNSGYNGIQYARESVIRNNVIENSCLITDDCGAIYTWNGPDSQAENPDLIPGQYLLTPYNSRVEGNIVINSVGNSDGVPGTALSANGIYLDNSSNAIEVINNTVISSSAQGIVLNSAPGNTVQGNTLYGNKDAQLFMREMNSQWSGADFMGGNMITDNIMFPLNPEQPVELHGDFYNNDFGVFDYNSYSTLYSDQIVHERYRPCNVNQSVHYSYSLSAWQQEERTDTEGYLVQQDLNSGLFAPFKVSPYRILSALPDNYLSNGDFNYDTSSWWVSNGIKEWMENCNDSGGCLKFTSSQSLCNGQAFSNMFSLQGSKTYALKFRAMAAVSQYDQNVRVILRNDTWTLRLLEKAFSVNSTDWKIFTFVFTTQATMDNARLDFFLSTGIEAIYIDDISLQEITVIEYNDTSNDSNILVNKTSSEQDIYCPDAPANSAKCAQYIHLDASPVTWPVTLAPFSSEIIVWNNTPFKDSDADGVMDDGDFSSLTYDTPCPSGSTDLCDDNCIGTPNPDQTDADGDGFGAVCDCNDDDASINPGAAEVCDGVDNDCDGATDEDLTRATNCGVGACASTGIETCTAGIWGNDTCVAGMPVTEGLHGDAVCSDSLDNDCDGTTDTDDSGCKLPDLVVSSLDNPPAIGIRGESFSVIDITSNTGIGDADQSTTVYYLSRDNIITNDDVLLTNSRSIPPLINGTNSQGSVTVTIPPGINPGNYYLGACADSATTVAESNDNNNCLASTSVIQVKHN